MQCGAGDGGQTEKDGAPSFAGWLRLGGNRGSATRGGSLCERRDDRDVLAHRAAHRRGGTGRRASRRLWGALNPADFPRTHVSLRQVGLVGATVPDPAFYLAYRDILQTASGLSAAEAAPELSNRLTPSSPVVPKSRRRYRRSSRNAGSSSSPCATTSTQKPRAERWSPSEGASSPRSAIFSG